MAKDTDTDTPFLVKRAQASKRIKAHPAPKPLYKATEWLRKAVFEETELGYAVDGPKLKAFSNRFKGQNVIIGNTVFSFDLDGNMEIVEAGNVKIDYLVLIKMNGVKSIE